MNAVFKLEYYLCLLIKAIILFSPEKIALKLGFLLSYLVKISLPGRRKLVLRNLSKTFPSTDHKKIISIAKNVWKKLSITLVEFIRIEKLNKRNLRHYVEFENVENLKEGLKANRGVLLLTAHFGNWELMGAALSMNGFKIMVIARQLKNIYVNNEVDKIRESSGEKVVNEHSAIRESLKWLKSNGCIGILIDQHITEGGVAVDFLGRKAATSPIIVLLAKKTGAKIVPIYNYRLPSGKIKIIFEKPVELITAYNDRNDLIVNTEAFNKIISRWITERPDEWFWLHNRWKVPTN